MYQYIILRVETAVTVGIIRVFVMKQNLQEVAPPSFILRARFGVFHSGSDEDSILLGHDAV